MLHSALLASATVLLQALSVAADISQSPLQQSTHRPHRIAIIGAGPGGSSASYHLRKFSQSLPCGEQVPLDITVLDANTYIGGRTTTVNALDDPRYPVELGASIFLNINHILYNATRDFGLPSSVKIFEAAPESKYELGIWDGEEFVFKAERDEDEDRSTWKGWWDIAKLLWKYGMAPLRTRSETRKAVGQFLKFYEEPIFPFQSIQEAVDATGLQAYTGISGEMVLKRAKVGESFAREIIQASTRVNYASNLGGIHGLETLVCMAIEGAMAVDGGNWQIFDNMVSTSADRLFLNNSVTGVVKDKDTGRFSLKTTNEELDELFNKDRYDTVILAAPYQFSDLTFTPPVLNPPVKIPYVELYVTLFTSPHRLSPAFFGLDSEAEVPSSVLTTLSPELSEQLGNRRGAAAVGPSGVWSISTLRVLNPFTDGVFCGPLDNCDDLDNETQYLYKIFSPAPLTGIFLSSLLDFEYTPALAPTADPLSKSPKSEIPWLVEKHWHSYPYELPRTTFENFTLCVTPECARGNRDGDGIYYLNGMESFISTMETSALAGMNVARLIVDRLHDEKELRELEMQMRP